MVKASLFAGYSWFEGVDTYLKVNSVDEVGRHISEIQETGQVHKLIENNFVHKQISILLTGDL